MEIWSILKLMGNKIQNLGAPVAADDAATKQYVDDHIADTVDAHDAVGVSFDPTGMQIVTAVDVQDAIEELDAELDAHEADTSDAHDASAISVNPAGTLAATDAQAAFEELASEADADAQDLADHIADASDAHDAAAISVVPVGTISATDVQAALAELASDAATDDQNLADHIADSTGAHAASAISFTPVGDISASDVQAALAEISVEKATVQYVDDKIAGLSWKAPVRAATTADITLSAPQTIDGVSVIAGDRVLVKDQTLSEQNGIYDVAAGAWTRVTDANTAAEILQAAVLVQEGTANADKGYSLTTNAPIVLNTTPLTFTPFGYSGTPTGPASGVLSGTYPNPGFAVDMATQAELDALAASAVLDGDTASGVLAGTYPNPTFAADMATQAELDAHVNDLTDAHDGTAVSFDPTGTNISATDVQQAIEDVDQDLEDHLTDAGDAHDASAISVVPTGALVATDAQSALAELDSDLTAHIVDTVDAHDASAISYAGSTNLASTNVEAALDELDTEKTKNPHKHSDNGSEGGAALYPQVIGAGSTLETSFIALSGINNWDPGGTFQAVPQTEVYITSSTFDVIITGLVSPAFVSRFWVHLVNQSGKTITLVHQSASSFASNRFVTPNGTDYVIKNQQSAWLFYSDASVLNKWMIIGADGHYAGTVGTPASTNPFVTLLDPHNEGPINNGGMEAWKTPTVVNPFNGEEVARNWFFINTTDGALTVSRNTSVPAVGNTAQLLNYSMNVDVTTADGTIGAAQQAGAQYRIEGWKWATLAQRIFTVGFWVKSTKTGIHCVALRNAGLDRSCVMEYSVAFGDTWQYVTLTFPASPSAGTWNYQDGVGVYLQFIMAAGTNFHTAAGAWQTGNFIATASQQNSVDSASNFFSITGVKVGLGPYVSPYLQSEDGKVGTLGIPNTSNPYVTLLDPHDEGPITNGGFESWTHSNPYFNVALSLNNEYAKGWALTQVGAGAIAPGKTTGPGVVDPSNQLPVYALMGYVGAADASIAAGDIYALRTTIEGLKWAAYAQRPFTIGFWVKSAITGTHCVSLRNIAADRSCVMTYTINVINTWEYKTVTFPPSPSAGTWNYTDGVGVYIDFAMAVGSSFHTTAGAWQTGNFLGTSGQVNVMATVANQFVLWGVKAALGNYVSQYKTPGSGEGTYGAPGFTNPHVTMLDPHNDGPIINGGMNVAQRGQTIFSVPNAGYTLDQWQYSVAGAAVVDVSQDATTLPPVSNYGAHAPASVLTVDVQVADTSIAAGDLCMIQQNIEGYQWAPYAQRQFTIGFWVKSTITGIYCVAFRGAGLSYVAEYNVITANTWEYKTITVPPTTSAGWNVTNGIGVTVSFVLAVGTTYQVPAGFWWGGTYLATSSQVNGVSSSSNLFSLWGVKIGLGPYVSPYVARPYQQELALCRRYLYRIMNDTAAYKIITTGQAFSTTQARFGMPLPVPMRVAPTLAISATGDFVLSSAPYGVPATTNVTAAGGVGQHAEAVSWDGVVASGLVAGNASQFVLKNVATVFIQWSAEM